MAAAANPAPPPRDRTPPNRVSTVSDPESTVAGNSSPDARRREEAGVFRYLTRISSFRYTACTAPDDKVVTSWAARIAVPSSRPLRRSSSTLAFTPRSPIQECTRASVPRTPRLVTCDSAPENAAIAWEHPPFQGSKRHVTNPPGGVGVPRGSANACPPLSNLKNRRQKVNVAPGMRPECARPLWSGE